MGNCTTCFFTQHPCHSSSRICCCSWPCCSRPVSRVGVSRSSRPSLFCLQDLSSFSSSPSFLDRHPGHPHGRSSMRQDRRSSSPPRSSSGSFWCLSCSPCLGKTLSYRQIRRYERKRSVSVGSPTCISFASRCAIGRRLCYKRIEGAEH
jgi:hypothetical protein